MKLVLVTLLLLFSYQVCLAKDCNTLANDDPLYQELMKRMGVIKDHAPSSISHCAAYKLHWKATWDVFEEKDGWTKRADGQCWGKKRDDAVCLYGCGRSIIVASLDFNNEIRLSHDIDIERVKQLIAAARRSIGPEDRVTRIEYTPVRNGTAWSETEFGYQVRTSNHPHYMSGRILEVKLTCDAASCTWSASGDRVWMQ